MWACRCSCWTDYSTPPHILQPKVHTDDTVAWKSVLAAYSSPLAITEPRDLSWATLYPSLALYYGDRVYCSNNQWYVYANSSSSSS
jgi:hypothetical protein